MPDHVHGILEIKNRVGTRHAVSLQGSRGGAFGRPQSGSVSSIIGAFKSAATKRCRRASLIDRHSVWQPRFFDRIIRDDKEQFFIEQYITLNPLIWYLERQCMARESVDPEDLRRRLKEEAGLDDYAAELVMEHHAC